MPAYACACWTRFKCHCEILLFRAMALRNLLVCISSAGGQNDLPCLVLHSPSRDVSLQAARSVLATTRPCGPSRTVRHTLPAADPGRHSTHFEYERAATSLMIDLSQSEVARSAALDWLAPIAPTRHVQGVRRSIVMHCADLLTWPHQNALKKVIEATHSNTFFILTTSHASALQAAILSRGVVIRCPGTRQPQSSAPRSPAPQSHVPQSLDLVISSCVSKAIATTRSAAVASKAARESACVLSKLYTVSSAPTFMRCVLDSLVSQLGGTQKLSDSMAWDLVQEMMNVDLQLCTCKGSIKGIGPTLFVSLHRALLATSARLYK